jgi:hypothetical protein
MYYQNHFRCSLVHRSRNVGCAAGIVSEDSAVPRDQTGAPVVQRVRLPNAGQLASCATRGGQGRSQPQAPLSSLQQNRSAIGTALPFVKLRDYWSIKGISKNEHSLLWYVRTSEGLTFGVKSA